MAANSLSGRAAAAKLRRVVVLGDSLDYVVAYQLGGVARRRVSKNKDASGYAKLPQLYRLDDVGDREEIHSRLEHGGYHAFRSVAVAVGFYHAYQTAAAVKPLPAKAYIIFEPVEMNLRPRSFELFFIQGYASLSVPDKKRRTSRSRAAPSAEVFSLAKFPSIC